MIDYIIDTSIVIQHLITESHTVYVDSLFDEVGETVTLHAPEFCFLECANVLWKQVRFQGMTLLQAEELVDDLIQLPIIPMPVVGLSKRALSLGVRHQLAIYDSLYIALTENLGYPLITDDAR